MKDRTSRQTQRIWTKSTFGRWDAAWMKPPCMATHDHNA